MSRKASDHKAKIKAKAQQIKKWLPKFDASNDLHCDAVARMLITLLRRQTEDERATETTKHVNLRGFGHCHAGIGTALAKQVQQRQSRPGSQRLTTKQWYWAVRCVRRYTSQLAEDWVRDHPQVTLEEIKGKAKGD